MRNSAGDVAEAMSAWGNTMSSSRHLLLLDYLAEFGSLSTEEAMGEVKATTGQRQGDSQQPSS